MSSPNRGKANSNSNPLSSSLYPQPPIIPHHFHPPYPSFPPPPPNRAKHISATAQCPVPGWQCGYDTYIHGFSLETFWRDGRRGRLRGDGRRRRLRGLDVTLFQAMYAIFISLWKRVSRSFPPFLFFFFFLGYWIGRMGEWMGGWWLLALAEWSGGVGNRDWLINQLINS